MSVDGEQIHFIRQPTVAGFWCVGGAGGLRIATRQRPRWLTRVLMHWLVEWQWRDAPEKDKPQ